MLILKGLVGLHRTIQLHLFSIIGWGIDLDYCNIEWFYEDVQDLQELTLKKDVLFIIGDWNAKVGSQETPGVTGKFGLGIWNEAGQRLTDLAKRTHWS